jgi:hypothetical protein
MSDHYAERHPGYSFVDTDGSTVTVPASTSTPAAEYRHEPMTRAQASDVLIAFGLATGCACPIRCKPNGAGFDAMVPLEFIARLEGVKRLLGDAGKG